MPGHVGSWLSRKFASGKSDEPPIICPRLRWTAYDASRIEYAALLPACAATS